MIEIYMDQVYDIISSTNTNKIEVNVRDTGQGSVIFENLNKYNVGKYEDFKNIYKKSILNRATVYKIVKK